MGEVPPLCWGRSQILGGLLEVTSEEAEAAMVGCSSRSLGGKGRRKNTWNQLRKGDEATGPDRLG